MFKHTTVFAKKTSLFFAPYLSTRMVSIIPARSPATDIGGLTVTDETLVSVTGLIEIVGNRCAIAI